MSEKYKEILLAGNAAIAAGDHEGFLVHCSADTEWHFVGDRVLRGKDAVRRWMRETYLEPPQVTVENLVSEGRFLIAQGMVTMNDATGKDRDYAYCDMWEFRDDKMVALRAFVIEDKDLTDPEQLI